MLKYYQNESLFSEIYLDEITQQPEQQEALASLKVLREYRDFADKSNLADWTKSYIQEVLAALGFSVNIKGPSLLLLNPMGVVESPVTLCWVTLPGESLDNTTMGRNWAEKTIRALREQGMQWGLLTNGEKWRIYHLDEPAPYETYLEIDLERILDDQANEPYLIFHKFMKAGNFVVDGEGKCRFDQFKQDSKDKISYIESELANALKQREEGGKGVLSDICMGYVDQIRRVDDLSLDDEYIRRKIYHGAMLYMFRLLFLLYADARGLLHDENHISLRTVKQEAHNFMLESKINEGSFILWSTLAEIFVNIDQTYNGGLFSPQENDINIFIEESRIDDLYLASVIANLSNYREKDGREREISYRDMSVRHIGTLYEGLLEHKLFIATEDTEVKISKGKIRFIPESEGGKLIIGQYLKAGSVYFGNDHTSRKSSGSYYTPEYIVDYLVENTVGAKLEILRKKLHSSLRANIEAMKNSLDEQERKSIEAMVEEEALDYISTIVLRLTVLDPAMGSGHFLVSATNLISNSITEMLNSLGVEANLPTGTAYWRRWVVENCIYGVDLNPLAVELAKLSLWILSMAKDLPLSFMNHHIKCGDSLVGSRVEEIGIHPILAQENREHQLSLFEQNPDLRSAVEAVVDRTRRIVGRSSISLEDVEAKKSWLAEIDEILDGYKAICDVHTGLYFDISLEENEYKELVDTTDFEKARKLVQSNRFFHWELEFPEIFFYEQGFSCVVTNPPYDTFKEDNYFNRGIAGGTRNLFSHFIVKAESLNGFEGNIGFVVPISFACGASFEKVRCQLFSHYDSLHASHYSKRPNMLFDGVQQRITIFYALVKRSKSNCKIFSSKLWRWKKEDQENVVRNPELTYVGEIRNGIIPKVHTTTGAEIYNHLLSAPMRMSSLFVNSNEDEKFIAYYHAVSMYWIKAYDFIPHFQREGENKPSISSKLKHRYFRSLADKNIFLLLLNSSLFYYWWIAVSNEFDVQVREIKNFGIHGYAEFTKNNETLSHLVSTLMQDYQKNSEIKTTTLGGRRSEYQEFYPRKSISIIHEIDDFIAGIYGLRDEQNEFLKSFDLEWRTG